MTHYTSSDETAVTICGAGPAGLAAALGVVRAGGRAEVLERRQRAGARFHGDFQGLENWSGPQDVLQELEAMGIRPDFGHASFRELRAFDVGGREYCYRSAEPLFYLLRRGPGPDTLDSALLSQAQAAGVNIRFGTTVTQLPRGGIVTDGPHRADVIALGYVFDTDMADGAFAALSDDLAPQGYAYLLIWGGRGTVAVCLFADFHRDQFYLERAVRFFQDRAGLRMRNARRIGGTGNYHYPRRAHKGNILYAGEAAGFQDPLWGFGIRYALRSGHLAAQAWLAGKPERYEQAWRHDLGGLLRTGLVNRWCFARLGNTGYRRLLARIALAADPRLWLQRHYAPSLVKSAGFYLLRGRHRMSAQGVPAGDDCACIWCHGKHGEHTR